MKAILLTILILGLCGVGWGQTYEDFNLYNHRVQPLSIDYGDSVWVNPRYTKLMDSLYFLSLNPIRICCCTVFVVDTIWMMPIIPDYETVYRPIPLWMQFRWQQLEAILDSNTLTDLYKWQRFNAIVDSVLKEIK